MRFDPTSMRVALLALCAAAAMPVLHSQTSWPAEVRSTPEKAPVLTPDEALKTFVTPPGYRVELVASEPLVIDPIAIDFDADGRLWVLEMPGFMSEPGGGNSREAINNVVVLEDRDGDGRMDSRTVFADKLVLPRAFKVLDKGVLVGEPPNLWFMQDTDGDLKADTKELVADTYGRATGSIEHNANSLYWGLDNVMYTSEHDWHLRYSNGKFETIPTLARGQWGASMDDAGRIYRNVNDAPLFVDLVPARYYARNPSLVRTRGLYEPLIAREESVIWPVRQTRGVNRGYRDQFFRPDGSSVTIQGVGTPVIYRGDRLPRELYGDAFITDSTTNLVHQYEVVDDGTGRLKAVDAYARGEILASSDERFRPVNMLGAPDGTLFIVDMYRGIVQEQIYWTDYLRDYIRTRDLERPVHLGRIWRLVHETTTPAPRPALSKGSPAQLVETLAHPNGWWRDTAQQLLVQRRATEAVPALLRLAAEAPDWKTRLHALWTLEGLDAIELPAVRRALGDRSPDVRASAVRLSERWIRQPGHALTAEVLALFDDPSWTVRRQLAATAGELPLPQRLNAVSRALAAYGGDPVTVDAAISGVRGSESDVLTRLFEGGSPPADPVSMLAGAIARRGDPAAIGDLLGRIASEDTTPAVELALLRGLEIGLPGGSTGRGGRMGRGAPPPKRVALGGEPDVLTRIAAASDERAAAAQAVLARLDWPGKPAPVTTAPPLTPAQQKQFAAGAEIYKGLCAGCHQADGRGLEKLAPTLVGSSYTTGEPTAAIRVLLSGKEGSVGLMPPLGGTLNDDQIAAVLTYVRREWGNTGTPVAPEDVVEIRGLTKTRTRPYTDAELTKGAR